MSENIKALAKEYENILSIETERDEEIFWEQVNQERERFLRFIGAA